MLSPHQTHAHHLRNLYSPAICSQNGASHSVTPPLTPASMQNTNACYLPNTSLPVDYSSSNGPVVTMPLMPNSAYSSHMNKVSLKLNGVVEEMTMGWTKEEKEAKRRLVQFWRKHENNTIHCGFQAVSPTDRAPNSICVSCIYWQEKDDYFITSVDCIYLLESLIAVRFSVEEKNRIRRNLEGFRPITVSKCKPDSTEFFKLIMSFPNPKPRNIEKDVKVFPWKVLLSALRKIIGKYTANNPNTPSNGSFGGFPGCYPTNASQYSPFESHQVFSPGFPDQLSPQAYNAQMARSRFYPQDLSSIENRLLNHSPDSYNIAPTANQFAEQGQISPQTLDSSFSNHGSIGLAYQASAQAGPQRRHLYLRRHSLADPYTVPYHPSMRRSDGCPADDSPQQEQYGHTPTSIPAHMPYSNHPYLLSGNMDLKQGNSYSRDFRDDLNVANPTMVGPTVDPNNSTSVNQGGGAGGYQNQAIHGDYSQSSNMSGSLTLNQGFNFRGFDQPEAYSVNSHSNIGGNDHSLPPPSHLNHYGQAMYNMAPVNNVTPKANSPNSPSGSEGAFHRYA